MKTTPIPFSGAMVAAVLAGRKTQTRRLVKWPFSPAPQADQLDNLGDGITLVVYHEGKMRTITCPFGGEGDKLWVREAWRVGVGYDALPGSQFVSPTIWYEADGKPPFDRAGRYRHSRFMPRWASRLTLTITEHPGVERLQDISYEDIRAEGFAPCREMLPYQVPDDHEVHRDAARDWYRDLWDSLNTAPGTTWTDNPWVWVNTFSKA